MSWEHWIEDQERSSNSIDLDFLIRECVTKFELKQKHRKQSLKDEVHFLLLFYKRYSRIFTTYTSLQKVGALFSVDHSTVLHYIGKQSEPIGKRKKSACYEENIVEIKDYLESILTEKEKIFLNLEKL
jgi:hypothetical protein